MKIVNMSEARANLSRLVAEAVAGDPFIIARAGKPLVRVEVLEQAETPASRLGMLAEKFRCRTISTGWTRSGLPKISASELSWMVYCSRRPPIAGAERQNRCRAAYWRPLPARYGSSSPSSNISRMMSQPPTNSPLT